MENIYQNLNQFITQHRYDINMPLDAHIRINKEWRCFTRIEKLLRKKDNYLSVHRKQIDRYRFFDPNSQIRLHTVHIRHYEEKRIAEVYFTKFMKHKNIKESQMFYSPVFHYDRFVNIEDFEHFKEGIADCNDFGRIWIDIYKTPNAFQKLREDAYLKTKDECFYNWTNNSPDIKITGSISLEEHYEKYKKRWRVKKDGTSSYFSKDPVPWEI
ncbi:hypothetical protein DZB84_18510 [Bacillus sp. HNG]|uniref:hypothetical protein n=1 Tax=Bacillus sp. HNG TaxID=2293325 RepID=UPI000E2EE175|nr:hypothetical protein [Bacillus sp. HNG]RFB12742.1 hypothetical protein DZB84_18510 [Bacillus sp. HNG]